MPKAVQRFEYPFGVCVANVHDETSISRQINLISNTRLFDGYPVVIVVLCLSSRRVPLAGGPSDKLTGAATFTAIGEGAVHDRDCVWARPAQLPGPVGQAKGHNVSFVFWRALFSSKKIKKF